MVQREMISIIVFVHQKRSAPVLWRFETDPDQQRKYLWANNRLHRTGSVLYEKKPR